MTTKQRAVGAYIFAGGFTEGVKKHFDVLAHLEASDYGVATSRLNHPELKIYPSLDQWMTPDFWTAGAGQELRGVELMYCNPPCAAWSQAGTKPRKSGKRDYTNGFDPRDERPGCFMNCVSLLEMAGPEVLVVESVQGAWSRGKPFIETQAERAAALGYGLDVVLFDAFNTGLPQHRRRVFFVFSKIQMPWAPPATPGPTVRERWLATLGATSQVQPEPAPGEDYSLLEPMHDELLADTPEGGRLMDAYHRRFGETKYDAVRQRYVGRPSFLHRRLRFDTPGFCVGGDACYHPVLPRRVTVLESQVLAGYPPTYRFVGKHSGAKYPQINQAVTPPAGAWVASVVAAGLASRAPREAGAATKVYDLEGKGRDRRA